MRFLLLHIISNQATDGSQHPGLIFPKTSECLIKILRPPLLLLDGYSPFVMIGGGSRVVKPSIMSDYHAGFHNPRGFFWD